MPASSNESPAPAERLLGVLREGAKVLDETARLCAEQRTALIANDTRRLEELNECAETLSARFRMLESAQRELSVVDASGSEEIEEIAEARRQLTRSAAAAALAAAGCAELLARSSAATAALRRVVESAESAGYLPNGEPRTAPSSRILEKRA